MAFADPQSVTINTVAETLPRVADSAPGASFYMKADGSVELRISHTNGRRNRRLAGLKVTKFSPDPFVPTQNVKLTHSVHVVSDEPLAGFTLAEKRDTLKALRVWLTDANIDKLLGGEA